MHETGTKRTTIDLPVKLYIQYREIASRSCTTFRHQVVKALSEKLVRDEINGYENRNNRIRNIYARKVVDILSEYISEETAMTLVIEVLSIHNIPIQSMKREDIDDKVIEDISVWLRGLLNERFVDNIETQLSDLARNGVS